MNMKKLLPLAACAVSLFALPNIQATTILAWDFSEDYTSNPLGAQYVSPDLATGASYNAMRRYFVNLITSIPYNFTTIDWNVTDTFNASNDFIYFSVAPAAGKTLTLTDLVYTITGAGNAPQTGLWGYRVTLDGVAQAWEYQDEFLLNDISSATKQTWDFDDFTITDTDSVLFRFWAYGATSVNGGASSTGGQVRFVGNEAGYNMTLNAVIPESSSTPLGMGGLALLALLFMVKRRKNG